MGILRRAKYPQSAPIIRYRSAREAICKYLADNRRDLNHLLAAEAVLQRMSDDAAQSVFWQEDARLSIEVLHAVQRMANQLNQYHFLDAPRSQPKLMIGNIEISVWADLLVAGTVRGKQVAGAAILRMTQDDAATDAGRRRRREMGAIVASLAKLHVEENLRTNQRIANQMCMSIDIQHGEVFAAPASNSRRMSDIKNAAKFISAIWPTV